MQSSLLGTPSPSAPLPLWVQRHPLISRRESGGLSYHSSEGIPLVGRDPKWSWVLRMLLSLALGSPHLSSAAPRSPAPKLDTGLPQGEPSGDPGSGGWSHPDPAVDPTDPEWTFWSGPTSVRGVMG